MAEACALPYYAGGKLILFRQPMPVCPRGTSNTIVCISSSCTITSARARPRSQVGLIAESDLRARPVYDQELTGEVAIRNLQMVPIAYRHSCSAKIGTAAAPGLLGPGAVSLFYGTTVSSAALVVDAIVKVYTPEVGVTVVVERVPWIVPSVDPSKVWPP